MTLLPSYKSQLESIQQSPKFIIGTDGKPMAKDFPGYSVITPPWKEDSKNKDFYHNLQQCQKQLSQLFGTNLMIPVPSNSFHLTLADLIWENAFLDASRDPKFEENLRSFISDSFNQLSIDSNGHKIQWQVLGIIVMTRAVAVCLVPKDENSYDQVIELRRLIYQNSNLIGLGIEQQYHFTAHITLGYFGEIPSDLDIVSLGDRISELNDQWLENTQEIWVHRGELRKFDDMMRYDRQPNWPVVDF